MEPADTASGLAQLLDRHRRGLAACARDANDQLGRCSALLAARFVTQCRPHRHDEVHLPQADKTGREAGERYDRIDPADRYGRGCWLSRTGPRPPRRSPARSIRRRSR